MSNLRSRSAAIEILLLGLILLGSAALRFYGLNWDEGHWLHPDERQIYFVVGGLGLPRSPAQALGPDSPLNPHFFAYGSLPIYLLGAVAALLRPLWPALRDPDNLHLVGRPLAALFDLGTVYLTYRLARRLWPEEVRSHASALLTAALVGLAVLHVQLAHFYTADPLLTFFVLLTLNLAADVVLEAPPRSGSAPPGQRRGGSEGSLFSEKHELPGAVATQVAPFGPGAGRIRAFVYSRPLRGRPALFSGKRTDPRLTAKDENLGGSRRRRWRLKSLLLGLRPGVRLRGRSRFLPPAQAGGRPTARQGRFQPPFSRKWALGVTLGLALACKISAVMLIAVVLTAYHSRYKRGGGSPWRPLILTLLLALLVFFVVQPYALLDWPTFLDHTLRESAIARGRQTAPYTLQYRGTLPFFYSMRQTALWGLALPLGLLAWAGLGAALVDWLRRGDWQLALLLSWAGLTFAAVGLLYTRHLRYMLPLTPILCLLAVRLWGKVRSPGVRWVGYGGLLLSSGAYALAFGSIYAAPHSWIRASEWLYRQVPAGSVLAVEHWDTALPLPLDLDGQRRRADEYDIRVLPLYDRPDDEDKWAALADDLAAGDYVIVASRRLYGSIPRAPDLYPTAGRYYGLLFAGELGFEIVGEYGRGPRWLNPPLPPLPGAAPPLLIPDESFVVYDHPRALILRNEARLSAEEILRRLGVRRSP